MARRRATAATPTLPAVGGGGGILGSGIFGLFGSTVTCNSESTSLYCNFVKFFNVLIMLLAIGSMLFIAYLFLAPRMGGGGGGGFFNKIFGAFRK
jgi:hypothetical protein